MAYKMKGHSLPGIKQKKSPAKQGLKPLTQTELESRAEAKQEKKPKTGLKPLTQEELKRRVDAAKKSAKAIDKRTKGPTKR